MLPLFYVLIVTLANVVTAAFPPLSFLGLIVPAGTLLVGATFIVRDEVQLREGKKAAYLSITVASIVSIILSVLQADLLAITIASAMSFALSELLDTYVFSKMKHSSLAKRVSISGLFGGAVDSVTFALIGLSPLITGILPWASVVHAVVGQTLFKALVQFVAYPFYKRYRGKASINTL